MEIHSRESSLVQGVLGAPDWPHEDSAQEGIGEGPPCSPNTDCRNRASTQ